LEWSKGVGDYPMSKKDYVVLARIFAGLSNGNNQMFTKDYLLQQFCLALKADNGRFDMARFIAAATGVA
jgi:hypothetical protein